MTDTTLCVPPSGARAMYAITALRQQGPLIAEVMMGLVDATRARWDILPTPTRLVEVVDRLVEGDAVIALFPDAAGRLRAGPRVAVDVLPDGVETLALTEERPGRALADLPRF